MASKTSPEPEALQSRLDEDSTVRANGVVSDDTKLANGSNTFSRSVSNASQEAFSRSQNGSRNSGRSDSGGQQEIGRSVAGASTTTERIDSENTWEWMYDVDYEDFFMDLYEDGAPKSLDCGAEGYTASLTNWHELLALTAPNSKCGLVYVTGRFPPTAEALLGRVSKRDQAGGKGTFGVQFCPDPNEEFSLGNLVARGLINYRWPHLQYEFLSKEFLRGWYEQCTFVNEGVVYQITRITPGKKRNQNSEGRSKLKTSQFKIGGPVSFACACQSTNRVSGNRTHRTSVEFSDEGKILTCNVTMNDDFCFVESASDRHCSLRMELFVDGEKRPIKLEHGQDYSGDYNSTEGQTSKIVDLSSVHQVNLVAEKETVLILALSLNSDSTAPRVHRLAPTSKIVKTIVGVENDTKEGIYNRTGDLWFYNREESDFDRRELQSIARTSEYLLSVNCLYFKPFNMSDQHSLEMLSPEVWDSELRPLSSNSARSLEAKALDELSDPASIKIPESYQSEDDTKEGLAAAASLNWALHGTWLESATFVENVFFAPYVKAENIFWCLRFLIKVREFLDKIFMQIEYSSHSSSRVQDGSGPSDELVQSFRRYRARLDRAIIGSFVWSLKLPTSQPRRLLVYRGYVQEVFLPIGLEVDLYGGKRIGEYPWKYRRSYQKLDPDSENFLFISVIALYVLKFLVSTSTGPNTKLKKSVMTNHWVWNEILESYAHQTPSRSRTDEAKIALLQFLDALCWQNISSQLLPKQALVEPLKKEYSDKLESLKQRAGKLAAKVSENLEPDEYTTKEEELDRLIFLLFELFPVQAGSVRAHALRRIEGRIPSRTVKPGKPWEKRSSTVRSTEAPWELDCLNHHITLKVAMQILAPHDIARVKEICSKFLSQDLTFIPSTSRSSPECLEKLWHLAPSAIVCATLLDLDKESRDVHNPGPSDERAQGHAELVQGIRKSLQPSQQWIEPIPQQIFGDEWVQSLDDTPGKFKSSQTTKVPLRRNLKSYLRTFYDLDERPTSYAPSYSREEIKNLIPPEELMYFRCFDIGFKDITYGQDEAGHLELCFVLDNSCLQSYLDGCACEVLGQSEEKDEFVKWLMGRHPWSSDWVSASLDPEKLKTVHLNGLTKYREFAFQHLSDSLVDQGIKYRVLVSKFLSPSIVEASVYILHPQAIDAFDTYFQSRSIFANTSTDDVWTTSITLVYWFLKEPDQDSQRDSEKEEKSRFFEEMRNRGAFPASRVKGLSTIQAFQRAKGSTQTQVDERPENIEERSTALVFTGSPDGHLWVCSLWSSLVEDESLRQEMKELQSILEMFKNQPKTGRTLAFLYLLGIICLNMTKMTEEILRKLEGYTNLGTRVFLDGYDWEADDAVERLRSMMWGLESLRMLDDRAKASLKSINDTRTTLLDSMNKEHGKRHQALQQDWDRVIEDFDKRREQLVILQGNFELKIRQVTGLRDGLSTVTNVQDSHTALKQNSNIRILTYITIAYLPLSFITVRNLGTFFGILSPLGQGRMTLCSKYWPHLQALFSMSHGIIPDSAGTTLFAVLISIFVVSTFMVALSLETIISKKRRVTKFVEEFLFAKSNDDRNDQTAKTKIVPDPRKEKPLLGSEFGRRWTWSGLRRRRVEPSGNIQARTEDEEKRIGLADG